MIMEKKHILIALSAIMLVVGSILTVRAVRERHFSVMLFNANYEALSRDEGSVLTDCYDEPGEFQLIEYVYYYNCDNCTKVRFYTGGGNRGSCIKN